MNGRLVILCHASMLAPIVDLEEFLADNADDAHLCEQVRQLQPCQGLTVGGGSAVAFSISRID